MLTVPPAATLGETVQLNCSYHLQGESLYAIKLYKGRNEFLTYAAERKPDPLRSFPLKGIHIQVSQHSMTPHSCFLQTYNISNLTHFKLHLLPSSLVKLLDDVLELLDMHQSNTTTPILQNVEVHGKDPKKVVGLTVTLQEVNLFTTGLFGCEASAEESFHTALVRKQMTVLGKTYLLFCLALVSHLAVVLK